MCKMTAIAKDMEALRATFRTGKTRSKEWRVGQLHALQKLLTEGRAELCEAMSADLGKSAFEGYLTEISLVEHEIHGALNNIDTWMEPECVTTNMFNLPAESKVYNDPLGVVLVMGAWNYNVMLTLDPLVGAIAGGNCALVKPGSYAEKSAEVMQKLVAKYMDQECIRIVTGNRTVTAAVLEHKFDMIFFTGSTYVGKIVAAAAAKNLTPTILELGGKSPCIVDESANLTIAARRIVWGGLLNSGQTCVRPDYVLVHEKVRAELIVKLKASIVEMYSATPQKSADYGRIVNQKSHFRLAGLIAESRKVPQTQPYSRYDFLV